MFKTYYKVQPDDYAGWEACVKRWYWPFWINFNRNTSSTAAGAWRKAINHAYVPDKVSKEDLLLKGAPDALPLL